MIRMWLVSLFAMVACNPNTGPSKDPDENRYYSAYRDIYKNYGQVPLDTTRTHLETYLKEFPENADGWAFYGSVCNYLMDYEQAKNAYLKAVAGSPRKAEHHAALGTLFSSLGINDSAEMHFQKALQLEDSTAENYFHLALFYTKTGNKEKSLQFAEMALTKPQISLAALAGLSLVFAKADNKEKSEELYTRANELGLRSPDEFRRVLDGEMKIEDYYRDNHY